jgi:intracellular multiplication protein IcmE
VLVPAGRGIYAHTVLAVDSDTGGPIVLEADTGPLAGSRMLGSFAKNEGERLVVRVRAMTYKGKAVDVNGIVVSPDTMETAVASSVDEHYLERFALPFAAAFVEGLGQAVALGNSATQISPFGGAITTYNPLNFKQQAMLAGGVAAGRIGQTIQQAVPKGPTIHLAANVSVGVMFLADVAAPAK